MVPIYGWYCVCLHDFPEDEGFVYFEDTPEVGQEFKLPSSNYRETWVVHSVNEEEMKFYAVLPKSERMNKTNDCRTEVMGWSDEELSGVFDRHCRLSTPGWLPPLMERKHFIAASRDILSRYGNPRVNVSDEELLNVMSEKGERGANSKMLWLQEEDFVPTARAVLARYGNSRVTVSDEEWDALIERIWDKYETVGYQGERFMYFSDFDTAMDTMRKELASYAHPAPVPMGDEDLLKTYCDARKEFYFEHAAGDSDQEDRKAATIWGLRAVLARTTPLAPVINAPTYSLKEISDWIVECTEDLKSNLWAARVAHPDSMAIVAAALHDLIYSRYSEVPQETDNRDPSCIEQWPDCVNGGYDPKCCRFPKSCSCGER